MVAVRIVPKFAIVTGILALVLMAGFSNTAEAVTIKSKCTVKATVNSGRNLVTVTCKGVQDPTKQGSFWIKESQSDYKRWRNIVGKSSICDVKYAPSSMSFTNCRFN